MFYKIPSSFTNTSYSRILQRFSNNELNLYANTVRIPFVNDKLS
jgi:hypothetical protein